VLPNIVQLKYEARAFQRSMTEVSSVRALGPRSTPLSVLAARSAMSQSSFMRPRWRMAGSWAQVAR
jgi:hypothetical protein